MSVGVRKGVQGAGTPERGCPLPFERAKFYITV